MFDNFVVAKTEKRRTWKTVLISVSVAIHVIAIVALLIRGYWVVGKLGLPSRELTVAIAPPPPPPPPPPAPSKKRVEPKKDTKKVKRVKPMETTQPVNKKIEDDDVEIEIVEDLGVEGGVEGGVAGGVIGGVVGGALEGVPGGVIDEPPPPPPAPPKPKVVPQVAVEAQRIAGNKNIHPDEATKMQMQRDGESRIVANVKMCLTATGSIKSVNVLKSSGYSDYDRKIQGTMRTWKYRPFLINGTPTQVCNSVTYIYQQR